MIKDEKQFWSWWTAELKTWFSTKFSPLATESNVNSKADGITSAVSNVDSKVGQVKTETDKIQSIKDKTNLIGAASDTKEVASIFGKIADAKYAFTSWVNESWTTFQTSWITLFSNYARRSDIPTDYAKKSDVTYAQSTIMGKLNDSSHGLQKIKQAVDAIPTSSITGYAKESQVKDGNDTAISVAKTIRTETNKIASIKSATDKIGTPTAGKPQTIFAALEAGTGGGITPEQYNALAKQATLIEVQTSLDNEATEAEIYEMFPNLVAYENLILSSTDATVSGTNITINGQVVGENLFIGSIPNGVYVGNLMLNNSTAAVNGNNITIQGHVNNNNLTI